MKKPNGGLSTNRNTNYAVFICFCFLTFLSLNSRAQPELTQPGNQENKSTSAPDSSADVWDVYYQFINRKGHRPAERATAGFHPSVFPELAYALQTGFAVGMNANLSFTSTNDDQNISTIITTPQYTQYKQIIVPVVTNIWTKNNRYNIVSDWRYYDYSADNFGLGGNSPATVDDRLLYTYLRLHQAILRQILPDFSVGVGYALDYHWNIRDENNTPDLNDDFKTYNSGTRTVSSGLVFSIQYSTRRNPNNPQNGFFGNVIVRPNMRWLGSDQNWQSVVADFRKYIPLAENGKHILTFWNMNWLSFGGQAPYLDLPSTGWDTYSNLGRGYTQGRFRGRNLVYLETEYRTTLLHNGLLGGVIFANMQTYSDYPETNHFGRLLPGGGVGLRLKVNKHSNLNLAIDYGFGLDGSRGLFLNLGEVF